MSWIELEVTVARAALDAVSDLLFEHGTVGLEERDPPGETRPLRQVWDQGEEPPPPERVLVRAWFPGGADRAAIETALAPFGPPRWSDVQDRDWSESWKEGFSPFSVGSLVIAPPWSAPPGALVIEPGQGFGTGRHPTTRLMLEALVELAGTVETVLDVGAGSGILALAAAKLGLAARGVDSDPAAVADARRNAERNGLVVPFSTDAVAELRERVDLVLANLHAEVLVELARDLARLTGKSLVLGGILRDREERVRAAFAGLALVGRRESEGWVSLRFSPP